jgi:hypothetical protein
MKQNTDKLDKQTEPLLGLHTVHILHYNDKGNSVYFYRNLNILHLDHDLVVTAAAHAEMMQFNNDF